MLTFKWCFGRFVIFSPDLMWALAVFVLWNRQILSPKTLKSAFESEFLNGLELWSLSLSGWHIYIWKQIPIKGSGFTVKHSKSPCCFSIPCCKLSISSPKMIQFGTWDDSIWGKTATKKNPTKRNPTAGSKGRGFVHLLWQRWSSEIGLCALLETPCMILKEIASLFVFQILNL